MKEHESDVGHDLDAGWDDIEADVTFVSVKPKVAEKPVEVADLDAGWDFEEPKPQAKRSRQKEKNAARNPDVQKASQTVLVTPAQVLVPVLSKKARRELERQNQIHASKRKSEAKVLRKQQRLAKQALPVESPQLPRSDSPQPAPAPSPNWNKKSIPKRRHSPPPQTEAQQSSRLIDDRNSVARASTRKHESDAGPVSDISVPNSNSKNISSTGDQPSRVAHWRRRALRIALLVVLSIAATWIFFRGK